MAMAVYFSNPQSFLVQQYNNGENNVIEYDGCDKADLIEVLEALAYRILHYEHPNWYEIPESEVYNLLKAEGLLIQKI